MTNCVAPPAPGFFAACSGLILAAMVSALAGELTNSPGRADGAEANLRQFSLRRARDLAAERNWDLLAAAAGVDAASALKVVAHEFPNASLSLSTTKINVDGSPNSTVMGNGFWDRSHDTVVAINQLFEIGGKRSSRQRSAQAGYEAARAQFLDAKRILDLGVTKAYVAALVAQENARVLQDSAAKLRQEAQLAQVRLNAGEISSADKNQIDISAERFEEDARAAETSAGQARIALEVLVGVLHPNGGSILSDALDALASGPVIANTNSAGAHRPDVVAAEAIWRKTQSDLRLQKANRIPDPTVLAQYEHEPPDSPNSLGFGVSFPLPLWNRNRGNILGAQAAVEQARLAYEKSRAQAIAEIATSILVYQDADARWRRYRDSIRPKSEQVRLTKTYAYRKGGASLLDMLVAERDDNEVRLASMQAAGDTATALAALETATREITPSDLK